MSKTIRIIKKIKQNTSELEGKKKEKKSGRKDPLQQYIVQKIVRIKKDENAKGINENNSVFEINNSSRLKSGRLNFVQINKLANMASGKSSNAPLIFYFNTDDNDIQYLHSNPKLWQPPNDWMKEFSPLSGTEPPYDPKKWNENPNIKNNHNCYAYAMDHVHGQRKGKPQPGYSSGFSTLRNTDYSCEEFENRLKKDNPSLVKTTFEEKCPRGYYKGFIAIDPKKEDTDYHFYRQDNNGYWSHKPGRQDVVNVDADGKLIVNPLYANRNYKYFNYNKPCFFFCVNPKLTRSHSVTKH